MTKTPFQHRCDFYLAVCDAFGWCPNTGRVVFVTKGDDKAWCGCSTPGTHLASSLKRATVEDLVRQDMAERKVDSIDDVGND